MRERHKSLKKILALPQVLRMLRARAVKPATILMSCAMVEEHPSSESSLEGPTEENLHKKTRDI